MPVDGHSNFAYSTVATAPSPATSGTSLVVAAGTGALFPAVPFNATVWATGVNALSTNAEIVRVTAISTDTLTITRAQESTSARTVVVGDQIAATITKKTLTDAETSHVGRTTFSNANYTALTTDIYVAQVGTMSAARTVTLPAANAVLPGQYIFVADESGTVTATNTIIAARSGADTIDGGTSASIANAYGLREFFSDGTSKWTTRITGITAGGTGQTSKVPAFNALSPNTTVGDVTVHDGTDSVRLPVGTLAGAAIAADPNAANKLSWQYPQAVESAARGSSGSLSSTYDRRALASTATVAAPTSGTLRLFAIQLPKGLPVTNIMFVSGTTAGATLTHQWFALFDSTRLVLAKTADDTSTAWPATTAKTLAVTGGPFVTTYAGWYYIGYLITATTLPTIESASGLTANGVRNLAPIVGGNSTTGLTDPASCTGTQTAITNLASFAYAEIS